MAGGMEMDVTLDQCLTDMKRCLGALDSAGEYQVAVHLSLAVDYLEIQLAEARFATSAIDQTSPAAS